MAKFAKWIGAGIGWAAGGPIGAFIGYQLGRLFGNNANQDFSEFQSDTQQYSEQQETQSGDFEISLLILSAKVIKADGKIDPKEQDYVRNYFLQMYGKERANNAFRLFKEIIKDNNISTKEVCNQIRQYMPHASRLQLLHYLFAIAKSDNHIAQEEINLIHTIANYLYISQPDFESIKAMFYDDSEAAYTILEVSKSDTDEAIKKAYRKLVKKHHPDKVAQLGEEHVKGAQEKFLKIQEAYEIIKKERGF